MIHTWRKFQQAHYLLNGWNTLSILHVAGKACPGQLIFDFSLLVVRAWSKVNINKRFPGDSCVTPAPYYLTQQYYAAAISSSFSLTLCQRPTRRNYFFFYRKLQWRNEASASSYSPTIRTKLPSMKAGRAAGTISQVLSPLNVTIPKGAGKFIDLTEVFSLVLHLQPWLKVSVFPDEESDDHSFRTDE